jgi:hypothetical protein
MTQRHAGKDGLLVRNQLITHSGLLLYTLDAQQHGGAGTGGRILLRDHRVTVYFRFYKVNFDATDCLRGFQSISSPETGHICFSHQI